MIIEHQYIKKIFIFTITISFLVMGIYGYIFYQIRAQTRSSVMLFETLQRDAIQRDGLVGIEETLKNLKSRADNIDSYVVDDNNVVAFLELIEELGEEQGISITKKIQKNDGGNSSELELTLATSGKWNSTLNFLSLIENLPYSIKVNSFTARVSNDGDWLGAIEFNVASN
jgi:hypothetical protein